MVSPREKAGFSRRLGSGAVLLAATVALLLLPCADAAQKDTWSPRTFTADPFPVPPPDWQNLPFLRRQESARRRLLSGGGVSRPHWMPHSEYTLPWMLGDRKPLIPTDPSDGEADVAEAAATSPGNDGWLGANGAGVASAAAAGGSAGAGARGGPRYSLAQRKGVCSPVTPASPRIVVTTEADFVKRLKYPRITTVLMTLKADIMLKKGLAFGPYYSCTILQADVTGNRTISLAGADQPILRIVETFNVIVWGINFWMGVLPTSPACKGIPEHGAGAVCPTIHVYKSFGIQIAQGYLWGRLDLYRTMNSLVDGMAITGEFPFAKSPGSIRVAFSGVGTRAIKSGIVLSNNDIYGATAWQLIRARMRMPILPPNLALLTPRSPAVCAFFAPSPPLPSSSLLSPPFPSTISSPHPLPRTPIPRVSVAVVNTPVYLTNGAVGVQCPGLGASPPLFHSSPLLTAPRHPSPPLATPVQVVNNFLHQYTGSGVQCGTHVNNAGSCMMTFIGRNWFFPNVTITAKTDISNIRFTTHWISPGNAASCNYMLGGNSCFNLEADTTGVVVLGGACMGAFNGVNIENGKENRIQYVWVKDYTAVPGSATCPTVTTINCNTPTGKLWESKRIKYYNSPIINKRWPFLSKICKDASIGTVPCNVPTAGSLNARQTGKCSGLPTSDRDAWPHSSPLSLIEDLFPTSPALSSPYRLLKSTPAPTKSSGRASSPARASSAPASDKKGSGKKLQQSGKSASEGATSAGAGTALSSSTSGKGKRGKRGKRGKGGKKGKAGGAAKASETSSSLQNGKKKAGKKGKKTAVSSGKTGKAGSSGERKKGGHKWPREGTTGSAGERKKGGHKWAREGTKKTSVKKSEAKTANAPLAKKAATTSPASGSSGGSKRGRSKSGKGKKRRTPAAAPADSGSKSGGGKRKPTSGKSGSRGGSAPPATTSARSHKKGKTTKHSQEVGSGIEGKGSSNSAKPTKPPASPSGGSTSSPAKSPKGSDSDASKASKTPKPSSGPTSSSKPSKDKNSDSAKADSGSEKSGSDAKPSPPSSPAKPSTGKKKKPPPPADTSEGEPASSPPAAPVPKMICEKHKGQQLMVMDGNLFFTGNVEKCEGSCIKDSSCLMYTFSGLSCQLFTANMTARPVKACFSRKCQWGKCRDTEGDGSEEDSSGDGNSGGDTGGADESGGGDYGGDSSGGDSTGDDSTSDSGDDSSSDGATIDYGR
ncbi:unnamed protein product [Closterium sp. NIES-65]|nr:unnamed protein product [Closterium sp. NIES-65]